MKVKITLAIAFQEILSFLFLCHGYLGATTGAVCGNSSLMTTFLERKFLDLIIFLLLFLFISIWTCGFPHGDGGNR
jgi:hypothetical protein